MNTELQAIKDAVDAEVGDGSDFDGARDLADSYVKANPDKFTEYEGKDIPSLVKMVDVFRDAGLEDSQWTVEAWLLHRFEPQNIGGANQPQLRIVGLNK